MTNPIKKKVNQMRDERKARKERGERSRGVYLLPNLFTTGALFCGFYAVVASMDGNFTRAAYAIFIAMLLDGMDGRVARMTSTESQFGKEYDSLSDMISFGIGPALVMYQWGIDVLRDLGGFWGKAGWAVAFIYCVCAALRLARFNTNAATLDKRYFQGLASPAAAGVVAGFILFERFWKINDYAAVTLALFLTLSSGLLMVSNIKYRSFKDIDLKRKVPFYVLLIIPAVLALLALSPSHTLFFCFLIFAASGPFGYIYRFVKGERTESLLPTDVRDQLVRVDEEE